MPSPSQDPAFERTFSDLAYAVLQDRSPALIEYLVGFQVLDVDDEGNKAVGVFGCKVGDDWLYIPAFYLNGELKGMEMMFAKEQDIFLPNEENWVSYVLNRKPMKLGKATDVSQKDLAGSGLDTSVFRESPNQYNKNAAAADRVAELVASYDKTPADSYLLRKSASCPAWQSASIQPWTSGYMKLMSPLAPANTNEKTTPQEFLKGAADRWCAMRQDRAELNVPDVLAQSGLRTTKTLLSAMTKSSSWVAGVLQYYAPHDINVTEYIGGELRRLVKQARNGRTSETLVKLFPDGSTIKADPREHIKSAGVNEETEVRIITYKEKDEFSALTDLDNSDKEKLIRGDVVVKDDRPDETLSVEVKLEGPETLEAPTKGGCYNMLTTEGKKVKCFVVTSPCDIHRGAGDDSIPDACCGSGYSHTPKKKILVVNMDGPGVCTKSTDEVVASPVPGDIPGLPGLPTEFGEATGMSTGKCYSLVTQSGSGTEAFKVLKKNTTEDGQTTYEVSSKMRHGDDEYDGPTDWTCGTIIINSTSGKIRRLGETIFAPESARCVPIKLGDKKHDYDEGMPSLCPPDQIMNTAWVKNVAVPMKIYSSGGSDYEITVGNIKTAGALPRRKALEFLVYDQGLAGDTSLEMLKQADVASAHSSVYRTAIHHGDKYPSMRKHAASPYPTNRYTAQESSLGIPGEIPYDEEQRIDELNSSQNTAADVYDPSAGLDQQPNMVDSAVRNAAQTGQKDVFDTAVVGNLVKAVDSDNLVDKYIGDMVLGMDRVGRVYFLFLQHNDEFSERYGQEDLIELEDSLRNTFKSIGELVLFLKKKSVEVSPAIDQNNSEF